jgi:peptidoglycan/LPS O-acetylase OafA/YrhL
MRGLMAGIAGFVVYLCVAVGATLVANALSGGSQLEPNAPITSPIMLGSGVFISGIAALAGLWTSTRIGRGSAMATVICAGLIALFVAVSTIAYWNLAPIWYNVAVLLASGVCVVAGRYLAAPEPRPSA